MASICPIPSETGSMQCATRLSARTGPHGRIGELLETAIVQILGEEALDLESLAEKRRLSGQHLPDMNLGDYFFPDDDPLNPDLHGN